MHSFPQMSLTTPLSVVWVLLTPQSRGFDSALKIAQLFGSKGLRVSNTENRTGLGRVAEGGGGLFLSRRTTRADG